MVPNYIVNKPIDKLSIQLNVTNSLIDTSGVVNCPLFFRVIAVKAQHEYIIVDKIDHEYLYVNKFVLTN